MYYKNFTWLLLDKLLRIFGGLFIGVWIARYLGPSDLGIFNYALAFISFFYVFVSLGLDQIVVRELVDKPKLTDYILGTAFGLKFIGFLVALVGVLVALFFIQANYHTKIIIFILALQFFFQSLDVIDYFFQAKVMSKCTVIARNFSFISRPC